MSQAVDLATGGPLESQCLLERLNDSPGSCYVGALLVEVEVRISFE